MACLAAMRHAGLMVIEFTRIGGDGSTRRAVVDTAGRDDAVRWERLAQQAALEVPPPHRPEPGQPVYQISADRHAARRDLLSCRPAARQQGGPELGADLAHTGAPDRLAGGRPDRPGARFHRSGKPRVPPLNT
jgi:hypothetical protein